MNEIVKSTKIFSLALFVRLRVETLKIRTIVSLFAKWSSYHCMLSYSLELAKVWEICANVSQAKGVVLVLWDWYYHSVISYLGLIYGHVLITSATVILQIIVLWMRINGVVFDSLKPLFVLGKNDKLIHEREHSGCIDIIHWVLMRSFDSLVSEQSIA